MLVTDRNQHGATLLLAQLHGAAHQLHHQHTSLHRPLALQDCVKKLCARSPPQLPLTQLLQN